MQATTTSLNRSRPPRAAAEAAKVEGVDDVLRSIADSEYEMRWDAVQGRAHAANRARNIRFHVAADSFSAEPRVVTDEQPETWGLTIRLAGVGRADQGAQKLEAGLRTARSEAPSRSGTFTDRHRDGGRMNDAVIRPRSS